MHLYTRACTYIHTPTHAYVGVGMRIYMKHDMTYTNSTPANVQGVEELRTMAPHMTAVDTLAQYFVVPPTLSASSESRPSLGS